MKKQDKAELTSRDLSKKSLALVLTTIVLLLFLIFKIIRIYYIDKTFIIIAIVVSSIAFIVSILCIYFKASIKLIKVGYHISDFLFMLNIAFIIAQLFFSLVLFPTTVRQSSMYPTLKEYDKVIVRSLGSPKRFDIIVLQMDKQYNNFEETSTLKNNDLIVKRLIALPGDSFYYKDGYLYINGEQTEEPYLMGGVVGNFDYSDLPTEDNPQVIPKDYYYVMGDNRGISLDSRVFGLFHKSQIIGTVIYQAKSLFKWVRL